MHTPGPWREVIDPETGDVFVCPESVENIRGMHSYFIGNLEDTCAECHANASLIKAAPDLLEACELDTSFESKGPALLRHAAYELEQRDPSLELLVDELRRKANLEETAIAKARGK